MKSLKTEQYKYRLIAEERQDRINDDFVELLDELTELGNSTKVENYSPSDFEKNAHKFADLFTHWATVVMGYKQFPKDKNMKYTGYKDINGNNIYDNDKVFLVLENGSSSETNVTYDNERKHWRIGTSHSGLTKAFCRKRLMKTKSL